MSGAFKRDTFVIRFHETSLMSKSQRPRRPTDFVKMCYFSMTCSWDIGPLHLWLFKESLQFFRCHVLMIILSELFCHILFGITAVKTFMLWVKSECFRLSLLTASIRGIYFEIKGFYGVQFLPCWHNCIKIIQLPSVINQYHT